ncbi:MAG: RNA polymerase sigma-70 factor [Bacteroidales bacterium]
MEFKVKKPDNNFTLVTDESSFKDLYFRFFSKLCRFSYYITGSKEQAEEIVQGLFAKLWEQRQTLRIESKIESYLYVSVRNASYGFLKSDFNKKQRETRYATEKPEEHIFDKEAFLNKLQVALNELPEQCREIYCMKNLEGMSYKEIAENLGISERTVDTQLYRALKKLREKMQKYKNTFFQ